MRWVVNLSILVLLAITLQALPQQAPAAGSGIIEGIVVRADNGQPIVAARVQLSNAPIAQAGAAASLALAAATAAQRPGMLGPVATGPDGKFTFKDILAGSYRVAVTADGFVRQEYGQRSTNGQGRPVFVIAGQTLKDISVRLIGTATVSGRVLDENGQPATGAPVQLLRQVYSAQGRSFQVVGAGAVDDRGDYRVFGVSPGRYYVLAGTPPGGARGAVSNARFSMVYYPDAGDVAQAVPVDAKSASEARADMKVRRLTRTYSVRGRIIDAIGSGLPADLTINLLYRFLNSSGPAGSAQGFNPAAGAFEIQNVFPGEYLVQASVPAQSQVQRLETDPVALAARQAAQATRPTALASIRVVDADVEPVVLTLSTGVTTTGRFTLEGQPIASLPNLNQIRLGLLPPMPTIINSSPPVAFPPDADGNFQVVGLRDGEYRVQVAPLGTIPGFYVKSVRYGGAEILGSLFKFTGSGSGTFEVVMRAGAGRVTGTVTDARFQPVPGNQVFAVPAQRSRTDLYRTSITDQAGRFSITGLAPGAYTIFSWEGLDNGAQFDPDFLKQHETQGKGIQVIEGTAANVDVTLIPAP
jgi:hypothetical protein